MPTMSSDRGLSSWLCNQERSLIGKWRLPGSPARLFLPSPCGAQLPAPTWVTLQLVPTLVPGTLQV